MLILFLLGIKFGWKGERCVLPPLEDIARKRRSLGISQKELARLSGVSQSFIAKIESKKINPSYEKTKRIFDVLDLLETKRDVKAEEIMCKKVVGVRRGDSVAKAAGIMSETGYSQLPIFDGCKVVGSVTEKSILEKILYSKDPKSLSTTLVEDIMEGAFPTVNSKSPIKVVSSLLQYSPAVLVTDEGRIVGIITKADLLKILR